MFISLLMAGIVLTTSCDSDNDYNVVLPVYSDVVFTYNGNQIVIGYSALSYANRVLNDNVTDNLVIIASAKALYDYYNKAAAYFV